MPKEVLHLLDMIAQETPASAPECKRDLKLLDIFSGKAAVSKYFRDQGQKSEKYDIVEGDHCDLRTTNGFKHLLHLALRLEEDGLSTVGLPCTSYIFINAGTHKRSSATPYGAEELQYVKDANLLTSRVIMVLMVITVRCAYWLLEQPGTSQLIHHPELKFLLAQLDAFFGHEITRFWMASWGAASPKPSLAIGNCPWIPRLRKTLPKKKRVKLSSAGITVRKVNSRGVLRVSGGPKLKQTQVYPYRFAERLFRLHTEYKVRFSYSLRASFASAGEMKPFVCHH